MSRGMHHVVVHNKFTTVIFHHHAIGKRVPMNKGVSWSRAACLDLLVLRGLQILLLLLLQQLCQIRDLIIARK